MASAGVYNNPNLRIEGLKELNARLRAVENAADDMPDLMHSIGLIVIKNASPPRKEGTLAGTMRAGRGRTKAVVRAGYKKTAPYAGVVHYGNPHTGTRQNRFLVDALSRSYPQIIEEIDTGIAKILKKHNLT